MKKILIIGIIILAVFIIYLTTIDKKIYFLALGDEIALGITRNHYEKSYTEYIKEYLQEKKILETYVEDYKTQGYRITDIINDINNNKEIEETKKTIKNALIKADLVTISIGTNDIVSKIDQINKMNKIDYNKLKKNIETINNDLDKMLKLIREYCKEDIILVGIYINTEDEEINGLIKTTNEKFKQISEKHNVKYIDQYEKLSSNEYMYPNKKDHEIIGKYIIDIIDNNTLNDKHK